MAEVWLVPFIRSWKLVIMGQSGLVLIPEIVVEVRQVVGLLRYGVMGRVIRLWVLRDIVLLGGIVLSLVLLRSVEVPQIVELRIEVGLPISSLISVSVAIILRDGVVFEF